MTAYTDQRNESVSKGDDSVFLTILQTMYDAIIVVNQEQDILFFNRGAERIFGYLAAEVVGNPLAVLLGSMETVDILPGQAGMLREITARRKDGAIIPAEVGVVEATAGDQPVFAITLRDITERKKAEKQLNESEARFRALFYNNHAIMLLIDPTSGAIIEANPAACAFYGWSKEELIQKNVAEINTLNEQEIKDEMQKAASEQRRYFEFRHRLANGKIRDVEVISGPIIHQGKTLLYSIIHDITDRKKAEDAIQRHRKNLQLFVENTPAAIAMFDRDMKYISTSRRFLIDYGIEDQNVIGKSHYDVFPEISDSIKAIHQRCLAGAVERSDEDPFPRASGKLDWVRWEVHPWYESAGEIGGIILFSEVITERKQAEKRIRMQVERLKILHAIDLTIIEGYTAHVILDVLVEALIRNLDVDAADILLLDSANNLLVFAIEQGFHIPRKEPLSMQLGTGLAGRAALERKTIHIPDLAKVSQPLIRSWLITDEGFVEYYGVPLFFKGNLKGVLEVYNRSALNNTNDEWLDFLETLAGQAAIAIDSAQVNEGLQRANLNLTLAYDATIEGWSRAMDLRDKETENHTKRVTDLTIRLAREIGVGDREIVHIRRGCLLHDIGKLGVPDNILLKPDQLTEEEWQIMRQHPQLAFEMIAPIDYLHSALDIPYCHHERWDGQGYPRGISGEKIPIAARIFAIVDVWDALRSNRPYRAAWLEEKVLEYIRSQSGKHFDPEIVEIFLKVIHADSSCD